MEAFDIREILSDAPSGQRGLIKILHRVQARFGHVPPSVLPVIARHIHISESELFGVLTFYRDFTLQPRGRHTVTVCLGTACHVRGGAEVAKELGLVLALEPGQTTPDAAFSLETANCLGCCAIGPVLVLDGIFHARVTPRSALTLVEKVLAGERRR
jgi:NADH:ubiquinone oxidoreductase subunit E